MSVRFVASIRSKLMALVVVVTTITLLLASLGLGAYEIITFRRELARKLSTVADIVGRNSTAALTFGDTSVAKDILAALDAEPAIEGGMVFDAQGRLFAMHGGGESGSFPTEPGPTGTRYEGGHIVVVRTIVLDGDRVGTVYVRATLGELTNRLAVFFAVMLGIVLVCTGVSVLISAFLQRRISGPILGLAETARRVSADQNFSLRADPGGDDEIGQLVEDFNRMLAEIEHQDQQLREQQSHLTVEVANRTTELVAANTQLRISVGRVEHYAEQISRLTELGQLLQSCVTPDEIFGVAQQAILKLFPDSSGALSILNASGSVMETMAVWGGQPPAQRVFGPDDCWAFRRGRPHLVSDSTSSLRCAHLAVHEGPVTFCVPMMAQGDTVGVLQFAFPRSEEPDLTDPDGAIQSSRARLSAALAENVALAIMNLRLREALRNQSIVDSLTGLFNRRYLEGVLERECRRAVRAGRSLAVLMMDVDHFKRFNDAWGHDGGDAVLRELAALMRASFRGDDVACRYGGEEFVIVLADADPEAAMARAEQFRQMIQRLAVQYRNEPLGALTISIGLATLPENGSEPDELIAAADRALYDAKTAGRNRTQKAEIKELRNLGV